MILRNLKFSDLILLSDNTCMLKGTPEMGHQLVHLNSSYYTEISALRTKLIDEMLKKGSASIRFEYDGVAYRVAEIFNKEGRTWFLRRLANTIPSLSELGMPSYIKDFLLSPEQQQGLILFSGAQASGKTTSASTLAVERLSLFGGHGVTFENPAELPLAGKWGKHGHCFQTEIKSEQELAQHIEHAHRYASPNIIFIGEIRTAYAAIEALRVALGSSKQLVIATIHGFDILAALERLINWAEELDSGNARHNLGSSLLAIIHQELRIADNKKVLHTPDFLFVPFNEDSKGIRAKLRSRDLRSISMDINELKSRINHDIKKKR